MMPLYTIIFLFFTMANIALPGTSSFIGEFLILAGIFKFNFLGALLATTGMILGGCYSLWVYNRISYGNLKIDYVSGFKDIDYREFNILVPLVLGSLLLGLYPNAILDFVHSWCFNTFSLFI